MEKKEELLRYWINKHPGTRPFAWWRFDAQEPRKRIGGTGMPFSEYYKNIRDSYRFGAPDFWITQRLEKLAGLPGRGVDPTDPPSFESQAAYFERLDLLTP